MLEEITWKPGDLVRVKSGGPLMTVGSIKAGKVICEWFDAAGKPQRALLSPGVLVEVASNASDASDKSLRDASNASGESDKSLNDFKRLIGLGTIP